MRAIKYIVLHCTATPQSTSIESIQRHWRQVLGWKMPGYHFIIKPDGEAVSLLPIEKVCNGVTGYNQNSIHISYIGGMHKDDRTIQQKKTQVQLLKSLKAMFPEAVILGHRDFKGVKKACPQFDVRSWLEEIKL